MHAPTTHKVNTRGRENNARIHTGDTKYKGTAKQSNCHDSVNSTRLLLGVAKYKEYTAEEINSRCHGSIKTTRLLLGVAKHKESKEQRINNICMS